MARTVRDLLAAGRPDDVALAAPGRAPLTYGRLGAHVDAVAGALGRRGVGPGEVVAIVLANGPEAASAFLAVAAGAAAAPLNPAYTEDEFAFYLADLAPKALLVEAGAASPARAVARDRQIPVLEVRPDEADPAGLFTLAAPAGGPAGRAAGPGDAALVLHTSGTTSRPKMVPLSQANLAASAGHVRDSLRLRAADRCLGVMPLFHVHGLVAAVLASLAAGASVFCCPPFDAFKVFAWMAEARPTWYTAVPTMHQAMAARAARNRDLVAGLHLRFVRSSSASLPPPLMRRLEALFSAPVIEAYGMTEAAHQMASNPLPPKARKPGTVGLAAGPEVALMDGAGRLLAAGETGEVVVRGGGVFAGYAGDAKTTAAAFQNGWFRTGDEGVFDAEGYLTISGRLKEMINRGGEKVSPRQVDEAIMDHPAVAQVVAFALPHKTLGEEVAAAIVLRAGHQASARDIRDFAARRLAPFKVPRRVLFVDAIPTGPTGKLQRIGLARALGLG